VKQAAATPADSTVAEPGFDNRLTVLIVDDHKLFAEALRSGMETRGMAVVGICGTAAEAFETFKTATVDLALVDLGLPDGDGLEVARYILGRCSETRVLAVTASNDPRLVTEAMRSGIHGYLTKDTPLEQFMRSVEAAMRGQMVIPHRLAATAAGSMSEEAQSASLRARQLTERELEVLRMLAEGENSRMIATRLSVSPNTVRTHIQNILTKLQVHSRLEAATFAVRFGLVEIGRALA
jgi:DNA-binding NarL/FixJ family response regulator